MSEIKNIYKNMLYVLYKPSVTYANIRDKVQSIKPTLVVIFTMLLFSSFSIYYLSINAQQMVIDKQNYLSITDWSYVEQIASIDLLPYFISLIISAIFSIGTVVIVTFVILRIMKMDIIFKDIIAIVSYSWTPLIISTLINSILVFIFPIDKALFAKNIFDFISTDNFKMSAAYKLLSTVDPMYLWFLILLVYGLHKVYGKSIIRWISIVFGIWFIPVVMNLFL